MRITADIGMSNQANVDIREPAISAIIAPMSKTPFSTTHAPRAAYGNTVPTARIDA